MSSEWPDWSGRVGLARKSMGSAAAPRRERSVQELAGRIGLIRSTPWLDKDPLRPGRSIRILARRVGLPRSKA